MWEDNCFIPPLVRTMLGEGFHSWGRLTQWSRGLSFPKISGTGAVEIHSKKEAASRAMLLHHTTGRTWQLMSKKACDCTGYMRTSWGNKRRWWSTKLRTSSEDHLLTWEAITGFVELWQNHQGAQSIRHNSWKQCSLRGGESWLQTISFKDFASLYQFSVWISSSSLRYKVANTFPTLQLDSWMTYPATSALALQGPAIVFRYKSFPIYGAQQRYCFSCCFNLMSRDPHSNFSQAHDRESLENK